MFEIELNNPLDVEWEITNACNLRCRHCYVAAGEKLDNELNTKEALQLVEDLDRIGVTDITISGGEPFLRNDLWQVIGEIKSRKIPLMLYTNATILNKEKIKRLARHNVKSISVSLNGACAETHDFIQSASTFKKVSAAIKALNDHGIRVQVLFTLMKVNVNEFDALIEIAKELNIESICIYPFYHQGRGRKNLDHLVLNADRITEFLRRATEFTEYPPHLYVGGCLSRKFTWQKKHSLISGNACGKLTAIITADGHLRPCNFLPYRTQHSLREKSISELWNEPIFEKVRHWKNKMNLQSNCNECELFPVCMGVCLSIHSTMGSGLQGKKQKKGD